MLPHLIKEFLFSHGWNERILYPNDFEEVCESLNIQVHDAVMKWPGFYHVYRDIPVILLQSSLRGTERLWVAWHELGHALMHVPGPEGFQQCTGKQKLQADAVAAVAMIPLPILKGFDMYTLESYLEYPREICEIRIDLYKQYGL